MSRVPGAGAAIAVVIGSVAAIATFAMLQATTDPARPETDGGVLLGVEVLCVTLVLGVGLGAIRSHPESAASLGALAILLCLPLLATAPDLEPAVRAILISVSPLAVPCSAAAVAWLSRRARPPRLFALTCVLLGAASAAILAFGRNPALVEECVRTCLNTPAPWRDGITTSQVVVASGILDVCAAVVGVMWVAARGGVRARGLVAVAAIALALVCTGAAPTVFGEGGILPSLVAPFLGAAVVSVAVLTRIAGDHRAKTRLLENLATLSDVDEHSGARGATFAIRGDAGALTWVDALGTPVDDDDTTTWTLHDEAGPAARVPRALGSTSAHLDDHLTPAAGLQLANARLTAESRYRVRELRASQLRIVRTADAEGRRIERDLHDGTQQRLVSSGLHIGIARTRDGSAELEAAAQSLSVATANLRRLVHGTFPTLLHTEGLDVALDELRREAGIPVSIQGAAGDDIGTDGASAAYAVAAAAVAAGGRISAAQVVVRIIPRGPLLVIEAEVRDGGPDDETIAEFEEIGDRVGARGGTMTIRDRPDGLELEAVIPCVP